MNRTIVSFVLAACPLTAFAGEKSRVYTNDDLEKVAPYRGQTGVTSKPAAPLAPSSEEPPRLKAAQTDIRDERYWRQQKDRMAEQVRELRDQAALLAERVAHRRRQQGVLPYSDPEIVAMEQKRLSLEDRAREAEDQLEERARRAGALPGWLR